MVRVYFSGCCTHIRLCTNIRCVLHCLHCRRTHAAKPASVLVAQSLIYISQPNIYCFANKLCSGPKHLMRHVGCDGLQVLCNRVSTHAIASAVHKGSTHREHTPFLSIKKQITRFRWQDWIFFRFLISTNSRWWSSLHQNSCAAVYQAACYVQGTLSCLDHRQVRRFTHLFLCSSTICSLQMNSN